MNDSGCVLVVLGYGCHLTDSMMEYLDSVFVFANTYKVSVIITTGGQTNHRTAPGVSEAQMMADYLVNETALSIPVIIEDQSVTTNQNLQNVARIIREKGYSQSEIVIFCDDARSFKIRVMSFFILPKRPILQIHRFSKGIVQKLKQIFIATPLDLLAWLFPVFEKMQLRRKEKIMKES